MQAVKQNILLLLALVTLACPATNVIAQSKKPNIIFIMADDLGYGSLGCFGQKKIRTPNLDRMAKAGMKFTNFYSNSICAATRSCLITGLSPAHSPVRDNYELGGFEDSTEFGQMPLPPNILTLGKLMKSQGYKTAVFGKWGLGGAYSTGAPWKQGMDFFFGYLDQKQAHNYYPTHLWRNDVSEKLEGNPWLASGQKLNGKDPNDPRSYDEYKGKIYSCDTITSEALKYIRDNRNSPFFMYMAYTLPHMALQVPDEYVKPYLGQFEEKPYTGGGYVPNQTPHATYAAMITLLDDYVGRILKQLQDLHLDKNTLIIFTGDNGAAMGGGVDADYFDCSGILRGRKGTLYEGGIREPFVAYWPGKIMPGSVSSHAAAIWDVLPTCAEIAGKPAVNGIDGISFLPALLGKDKEQAEHPFLYWEIHSPMHGMQAVRFGDWKAVKRGTHIQANPPVELYDLKNDPSEKKDLSAENPQIVDQAKKYLSTRETAVLQEWNFYKAPNEEKGDK